MARCHSSSANSTGPPIFVTPTFLCRMSMQPYCAMGAVTAPLTLSELVTSAASAVQLPPSCSIKRRVSSAAARFKSTAMTFAPSRANSTATAFPFPHPGPDDPAPKTSAIFCCNRSAMMRFLSRVGCVIPGGLPQEEMVILRAAAHDTGGREPAINTDRQSRDEARLSIVEQKRRGAGKLLWCAVAALRDCAYPLSADLLGMHFRYHRSLDRTRSDCIDPNSRRRQIDRHNFGHVDHRGFRGAVGHPPGIATNPGHRSDVDDRSTAALSHMLGSFTGCHEAADEIDLDHLSEEACAGLQARDVRPNAGRVDKPHQGAKLCIAPGDGSSDALLVRDVKRLEANPFRLAAEVLTGLVEAALRKIGDDHTPALLQQGTPDGEPWRARENRQRPASPSRGSERQPLMNHPCVEQKMREVGYAASR